MNAELMRFRVYSQCNLHETISVKNLHIHLNTNLLRSLKKTVKHQVRLLQNEFNDVVGSLRFTLDE